MVSQPVPAPEKLSVRTYNAKAYAAKDAKSALGPFIIPRRAPLPQDVQIEILYCGVCHTDLHWARNDWPSVFPTAYPCVPGHEIVGRVTKAGSTVKKFKEGDLAAVGCMVDSCRACASCQRGEEQYCEKIPTLTYNAPDRHLGGVTYGGYSESIVVDEAFALKVPNGLNLAAVAPLLCAGITTYSPLRQWNVQKGQTVGVMGLGGLGHMAVKLANALGANVVVFTTSAQKAQDAVRLGAREAVLSKDETNLQKHFGTCDLVIDTIPAAHTLNLGIGLLKLDGTLALVGVPATELSFGAFGLLFGRRKIAGSIIGGIRQTQEMLDFCAEHGITPDIELIGIGQINKAFERLLAGEVKYRFVIDMASVR
jgi:alcohol dehydrogenase (NADP+)